MSAHPAIDDLFAAARGTDPESTVKSHVASCAECRARLDRLRGGAALLDEAASAPVAVKWDALDAVIDAEAKRVAGAIRGGSLRAPRRWVTPLAATGLALAAAAGLVLSLGGPTASERPREVVATHEPSHVPTPPVVTPPAPEPARAYEGAVMLVAGEVRHREAAATASEPMAPARVLREGATVETAATGRAVLSVQPGWALDVRPGSEVAFSQLREGEAGIALAKGEARVEHDEASAAKVTVRARGWEVAAKGDVVARVETDFVRVVVLSGHASVGREGGAFQDVIGPVVLELPVDGSAFRRTEARAEDPAAIDLGFVASTGHLWEIPAVDPSAQISVVDGGALPSVLASLRTPRESATLRARFGRTSMLLALDVRSTRPLAWRREGATTVAARTTPGTTTTGRATPNATTPSVPNGRVAMGQGGVGTEVDARALRMANDHAWRGYISRCLQTCVTRNQCRGNVAGQVSLTVRPDGTIGGVQLDGTNVENARGCVERSTGLFRYPATGATYDVRLPRFRYSSE